MICKGAAIRNPIQSQWLLDRVPLYMIDEPPFMLGIFIPIVGPKSAAFLGIFELPCEPWSKFLYR